MKYHFTECTINYTDSKRGRKSHDHTYLNVDEKTFNQKLESVERQFQTVVAITDNPSVKTVIGNTIAYDIAYGLTHMTYIFTKEN